MNDAAYMDRAISLAQRGRGAVEPNPMVGCVVVRRDQSVAEAWHERFGGPHAEVIALQRAGQRAKGATVYVTLEPCCHHGKTPPCTEALIKCGVSRVVIACVEPTPDRAGRSIAELEAAGIAVDLLPSPDAVRLIEPFAKRQLMGLPYVIAKWASTIDGATATEAGHSRWISNEKSRQRVHQVRARVDAILVGVTTVEADDPLLTARNVKVQRKARRVVVDPRLRISDDCRLIKTVGQAPLTIAVAADLPADKRQRVEDLRARRVEIVELPPEPDHDALDLRPLMHHLCERHEVTNLLVEGGGRTIGAMIRQNLVDELMVFVSPKLLGDGRHRPPALLSASPIETIEEAHTLELLGVQRIGQDVLLSYRLPHR